VKSFVFLFSGGETCFEVGDISARQKNYVKFFSQFCKIFCDLL